jgi:hypothetical protein
MTEPESPEPIESAPRTQWHPMLVALLERYLPKGFKLYPEYSLSRLPQRADIVVVRLEGSEAGRAEKIHSILDHLRAHTLIEHKGPTDDLAGEDCLVLLGYGYQYLRLAKITDPSEVCLMVVADRIPARFLAQLQLCGGELHEHEHGLWRGHAGRFVLHGVETSKAAEVDRLLFSFSRSFLAHPDAVRRLDREELSVYIWLSQQVEQFRRARGTMATKDNEEFQKAQHEALKSLMSMLSAEERLAGLPAKERLAGLPAEERLAGLPVEERLAGLTPEQVLAGLTPAQLEALKRLLH